MPAPAEAICQEVAWKNPELRHFCVALVRAALAEKGGDGSFTTDIVSDEVRALAAVGEQGPGMAGSAITLLKSASVIQPVGVMQNGVFYAARRASERPGAKSRWLNLYQLTSRPLAESFLKRNAPKSDAQIATEQNLL